MKIYDNLDRFLNDHNFKVTYFNNKINIKEKKEVVKQEEIDKRFKEDSKPLEDISVEDIIFPEMPM